MTGFQAYANGYRMGHNGDRGLVLVETASVSAWRCGFSDGLADNILAHRPMRRRHETNVALALELNRCRKDVP